MEKEFIKTLELHRGIVYKVCKIYCPNNANDSQDLFQDIVAQLWKAWGTYRGEAKITTWIYRIALNTAISGYRKQKRKPLNNEITHEALVVAQDNTQQKKEDLELLYLAISKLSETEKALVTLYLDEIPYDEVAALLGISQNNVRVKMLRIREKLRKIMEND